MTSIPLHPYQLIDGVFCSGQAFIAAKFEQQYVAVRTSESRIYTDEMVLALPDVPVGHPAYPEWQLRKKSAERLLHFCKKKNSNNILEIGCGNGWLSHFLANGSKSYVTGLDVNLTELQQAARAFKRDNLSFVYDNFSETFMPGMLFTDIVFAASIQYFPSIRKVLNIALSKLTPDGHIHILDTFLYKNKDAQQAAATRTQLYYNELGYAEMNQHYFHHCLLDLAGYKYHIAYHPHAVIHKLNKNINPFPWIIVHKTNTLNG